LLGGVHALFRQRLARQRAEELLRLGQTSRLNALGEMAAGLAHELNQPLTAVMANTQAAGRLLDEEPPELETARQAMRQAVAQARRAADVLGRLRATIERPENRQTEQRIKLLSAVHKALHLLEPECRSRSVQLKLHGDEQLTVTADPVGLEQILHNLINNALQAMEQVPAGQRQLDLSVTREGQIALLDVCDTGPGIAPDALPHLFEPFFSTRSGGLGLGLSLSETLASSMGGRLTARNNAQQGATFNLALPLSPPSPEQP
jgi:C4-dicarboxylate-specific signal transduction histidine kinase